MFSKFVACSAIAFYPSKRPIIAWPVICLFLRRIYAYQVLVKVLL